MLGLVCMHRMCGKCGGDLSRAHGTICGSVDSILTEDLEGEAGTNLIDRYLGRVGFQADWAKLRQICRAISKILVECCNRVQQDNGFWVTKQDDMDVDEGNIAFRNVMVEEVQNPQLSMARREEAEQRNRQRGRPSRVHRENERIGINVHSPP